jgi:peptide/nickel transport system substrate-binding protein
MPRGALRFDPAAGLFGLMPTGRSAALQEVDVRRLLSRAIDRPALVAGLRVGGLGPRATLLQAGLEGIEQVQQPDWLEQPVEERRASLLAEANRLFGNTERPTLRIALPQGPGGDYLFERLRYDWTPIGIQVERAPSATSADLLWVDEVAPSSSPAWFLRRFRCEVVAMCVEEADPLLAEARTTPDAGQRALLFLQAARLMDEAQLFIPIAAPIRWSLVSGRIPGFAENPFARHTLVGLTDSRSRAEMR